MKGEEEGNQQPCKYYQINAVSLYMENPFFFIIPFPKYKH